MMKIVNYLIKVSTVIIISTFFGFSIIEFSIRGLNLFGKERSTVARIFDEEPSPAPETVTNFQIHPYLGWSVRSGSPVEKDKDHERLSRMFPDGIPGSQWWKSFSYNAFGSISRLKDYRWIDESYLTVGIFGGSVAELLHGLGSDTIVSVLSEKLSIPKESVLILNFAQSGYKQPQQVNALSLAIMLGVSLDAVIHIDGFNEVALGGSDALSGYHPIFPSKNHYSPILEISKGTMPLESMELAVKIIRGKRKRRVIKDIFDNSLLKRSEFAKAIAGTIIAKSTTKTAILEKQFQEQQPVSSSSNNSIFSLSDPCLSSDNACWELITDIWGKGSLLMSRMASEIGAKYVHILQPNQYVPGSKILSEEELTYTFQPDDLWSKNVVHGYPYLQRVGQKLIEEGVSFHDLTGIFKDIYETLYFDSCCHFNKKGNQIFAKEVALILADSMMNSTNKKILKKNKT